MDIVKKINAGWHDLMENKGDPRVANWPLMSSPFPTLGIVLGYVYFVKVNFGDFYLKLDSHKVYKITKVETKMSKIKYRKDFKSRMEFFKKDCIDADFSKKK